MNPLRTNVPGETWKTFLQVVLGVWLAVWFYAAVHNQYLIRIEPEHFTVWHYKMPLITQTIQITAYLSGAVFSLILIGWTWQRRALA
jgi:hypothetical protein